MSKKQSSEDNEAAVWVVCSFLSLQDGVVRIWLRSPDEVFEVYANKVQIHPGSKQYLCKSRLIQTKNGISTVLIRSIDQEPVEVKVYTSKIFFNVNGQIFRFSNWREMNRVKKKAQFKRERGIVRPQPLRDF